MTFKAGESGNPNGRPAGSKNKRSELVKLLESHAVELVGILIERARGGDMNALKLCIERLVPKAAHEQIELDFNNTEANRSTYLIEFGKQILTAVCNGDVLPSDAKILSGIANNQRQLIEHTELKQQLKEIEIAIKQGRGK